MRQTTIPWTILLAAIFPEFKDKVSLAYMIEHYKEYLEKQSPSPKASVVSPNNKNKYQSAAGDTASNSRRKGNYTQDEIDVAGANLRDMEAGIVSRHNEDAPPACNQRHNYVNTSLGNKIANTTETHHLLAHGQMQWINSNGDSVFDNAVKTVHTIMNWYEINVTTDKVNNIPHIRELVQTKPLVESILEFSTAKNITLMLGTKSFEELLSCKNAEATPILIVAQATKHPQEANDKEMPYYPQFTVLMFLIQDEPHFILPASKTNKNLHLGKPIRSKDYGRKTFEQYMQINVNQKLVLITSGDTKPPERKLKFHSYYTTARATAQRRLRFKHYLNSMHDTHCY